MKHTIGILLALLFLTYGGLSAKTKTKSNPDEERLSGLTAKYGELHTEDNKYIIWYPAGGKILSLKAVDKELLTEDELNLLNSFSDVLYSEYTSPFFYIVDDCGRVGVYSIEEKSVWVPPIDGAITIVSNNIYAGSHVPYEEWKQLYTSASTAVARMKAGFGDFGAAIYNKIKVSMSPAVHVDILESKLVLPAGRYDGIMAVYDGLNTTSYIVARYDDAGVLRWGVTDLDGNEIVECKYSAVVRKNGKYVGTNDMTMDEYMSNEQFRAERRLARTSNFYNVMDKIHSFAAAAAPYLEVAGTALQTASTFVPSGEGSSYSDSGSSSGSLSSDSDISDDSSSGDKRSASEVSSKNQAMNIYTDYENQLSKMKTYPDTYNDMQRRDIQSKMKSIREKWESKGYSMRKSQWEDWPGL